MKIFKKVKNTVGGGGGAGKPLSPRPSDSENGAGLCDLDNIWGEVEGTVGDSFRSLPVHKDLHRLAPSTRVWDSEGRQLNGPDLFAEDADDERRKRFLPTKRVLWALASTVDPAKCDHIMTVFEEKVVRGSVHDIVGSMLDFFGLIDDGEVVVPRLRSLRILKLVNQAILAPAVIHLNLFMTKSPEKETYMNAGDWKIHINFQKDGRVTVRHSKWEKTKDSSFKWHLKMTLNDSLSMLEDASFAFLKLRFPATEAGEARKRAFLDYIGKYYSGQARIAEEEREMWARPHNKLPIHKSLAAIAFRSSVSLQDKTLFSSVPDAPAEQNIKSLLLVLAQVFSPNKEEVIANEFEKHYQKNDVVLKLSDDDGDEARGLTAVLKTLHSSVIAPCLMLMHERVGNTDPASPSSSPSSSLQLPAVREKGDVMVTIHIHHPAADPHGAAADDDDVSSASSTTSSASSRKDDNESGSFARCGEEEDQQQATTTINGGASAPSTKAVTAVTKKKERKKKEDRWVTVRHSMQAVSEAKPEAENYFEFGWQVEMDLDHRLERMVAVRMGVADLRFGARVDSDARSDIEAALRKALE
ncbi:uncharacterized protein ACA1_168930 [Acanthamoeba castellanii str. Neff]|uniref:Ras guanine nucleotide exchange factor glfB-like C-terminal domain-containing protein n=1 Tax=Acanthamoeba castellanii (strain ATCC 30010 / Neff) TaxID=1257118 RepID=L8HGH5_ACACF|nr:uncharacterized protein ACA1_168930 [Acanthamoeba castellanii str. Neff]ELR24255.1 hypothetical protein ACA1_168930 [Acanthamoeba castellanii str. Neff]